MSRKFYKTTITYEVLSEEPIGIVDLSTIALQCDNGPWVGHFIGEEPNEQELTPKQAADELLRFGSDPGFFCLNDQGEDTY